jgi:hypothetical protein
MAPLEAMYVASMVVFAPRSFEGEKPIRDDTLRYVTIFRRGRRRRQGDLLRLNEGAANDSFFSQQDCALHRRR